MHGTYAYIFCYFLRYVSVENNTLEGTWLWTKVPIYFIYPPSIFRYMSLHFNYHIVSKQVQDDLTIQLPAACYNTSDCPEGDGIVIHNRYLDVLTNEVKCLSVVKPSL